MKKLIAGIALIITALAGWTYVYQAYGAEHFMMLIAFVVGMIVAYVGIWLILGGDADVSKYL